MIEDILNYISQLSPFLIYCLVFFIAYIENVFPPSPSDVIVAVAGSLTATGRVSGVFLIIFATLGSTFGFVTMYYIGKLFGKKVIESGRLKFINQEAIDKFERWFLKYENWLIVGNRFLAGTRAVVAFCIGLSHVNLLRTIILSFISSLLWNTLLIFLGSMIGNNVPLIDYYLSTYNKLIISFIIILSIVLVVRYYWKKKKVKQ